MLEVLYGGPHQVKDVRLPDGSLLELVRNETATVDLKWKEFLKRQRDLKVKDLTDLSVDILL